MEYYHGSKNGNLTELTTEKANHNGIYFAEDYCFAVMYAGNGLRFWAVDKPTGKLIVREVGENALELLYKNQPCYIYKVKEEDLGCFNRADFKGRKSVVVTHNVKLSEKEFIPDCLEKLYELEKQCKLIIRRWNELSTEEQQNERKTIIKTFKPGMQLSYDKFPEEYSLLIKLFPELKLENLKEENK